MYSCVTFPSQFQPIFLETGRVQLLASADVSARGEAKSIFVVSLVFQPAETSIKVCFLFRFIFSNPQKINFSTISLISDRPRLLYRRAWLGIGFGKRNKKSTNFFSYKNRFRHRKFVPIYVLSSLVLCRRCPQRNDHSGPAEFGAIGMA